MRIKHYLNGNSVKAYDKAFTEAGNVLRLILQPSVFLANAEFCKCL